MKLLYATIAEDSEARQIGLKLFKAKLTNYLNIFPVTSLYVLDGESAEESEVVMIITIQDDKYDEVCELIKSEIEYDNFIGQLEVERVNEEFLNWLGQEIKK